VSLEPFQWLWPSLDLNNLSKMKGTTKEGFCQYHEYLFNSNSFKISFFKIKSATWTIQSENKEICIFFLRYLIVNGPAVGTCVRASWD
jgi:hypothetical protein